MLLADGVQLVLDLLLRERGAEPLVQGVLDCRPVCPVGAVEAEEHFLLLGLPDVGPGRVLPVLEVVELDGVEAQPDPDRVLVKALPLEFRVLGSELSVLLGGLHDPGLHAGVILYWRGERVVGLMP